MRNFMNLGRGVALASSTLALGSALAISSSISSAQAAVLGAINITGGATIGNVTEASPANDFISFTSPFTTVSSEGAFAGFIASTIANINLTRTGGGVSVGGTTLTGYEGVTANGAFITFANGATFVVDNPTDAVRSFSVDGDENTVGYTFPTLRGTLFSGGRDFISRAILTANQISGTGVTGSFSFTLSSDRVGIGQPVPEPGTIGALAALGIGAFFTNNVVKKKAKINA